MAIQLMGADGVTLAAIDAQHLAQRASLRPVPVLTWATLSLPTGLMTGIVAGQPIYALRNTGPNLILMRRVMVGAVVTTAFTAAQRLEYALVIARGYTTMETNGTAVSALAGKHRTSFPTPSIDGRIAQTGALSGGTRTVDAHAIGMVGFWSGAVGARLEQTMLHDQSSGDYPIVLAQNEGILVTSQVAMGAGGVVTAYITSEFAEAGSY